MKKNMSLRRTFYLMGIVAIVLPLFFFSLLFQIRSRRNLEDYMQERMQQDLRDRSMLLDLALEKYEVILDDFVVEDDLLALLQLIYEKTDSTREAQEILGQKVHGKMIALCRRHEGIENIAIITDQGELLFPDESMEETVQALQAGDFGAEGVDLYYQGMPEASGGENTETHLIQIVRRFSDDKNGDTFLGTAILSLNQEALWQYQDLQSDSDIVICEGDRIIASENGTGIGEDISQLQQDRRMILSLTNEKTGWTIWNFYSMGEFQDIAKAESLNLLLIVFLVILLLLGIGWYMTGPIMSSINDIEAAMGRMEQGDFSIRLTKHRRLPGEMVRIIDGYNTMAERTGELLRQVRVTMEGQKNAELSAMEAQIDPHFLYNTLDTINWKAIEKEDYEVSAMVGALADILRYTIRNPGDTVSIHQELYWLDQYIMFQREKLKEKLEVIVDVPQEIRECRIHKLLLQPFVENTIRHGFYQQNGPFRLKLRMNRADEQIHIMIEDNGRGISPELLELLNRRDGELAGHVGIANVKKRLALYYGDDADLYFESREGSYTIVHLFVKALDGKGEEL